MKNMQNKTKTKTLKKILNLEKNLLKIRDKL